MNLKKLLLVGAALCVFGISAIAADDVGNQSGTVANMAKVRYNIAAVGANSPTYGDATTSTTNLVLATPGVVGKVVFVPSSLTDTLTVYDAKTVATATAARTVFKCAANSPTMGNSPTAGLNIPAIYDIGGCTTNGIVTIHTRPSSPTASPAFLLYDKVR